MSDTGANAFAEMLEPHELIAEFTGMLVRSPERVWLSIKLQRADGPLRIAMSTEEATSLHKMLGSLLTEAVDERTALPN
ncbi:MAG: hypothetical protein ACK4TP_17405 [Hyphomicrobium sp.]